MAGSDIIKIGFDYRSSLAQFEKDTNGVFDGISSKAGKQKITIQLDAKDDKVIDKIKELQKLKLDKFTFEFGNSGLKEQLQTFDKLENKINEIINLSKGIGNSSTPIVDVNKSSKEIDKLESKLSELSKKYDELQKKSATGGISGKEVNLVDNVEFKKLSQEVSELKGQFDDLKTHMSLLADYTVPTDRFFELQTQVEATSIKVSDLVDKMTRLSNIQKNIGNKTNISSENNQRKDAFPKTDSSATNASTSAIKEENNALEQIAQSAEKAANSKKKFAKANSKVKESAEESAKSVNKEKNAMDEASQSSENGIKSKTFVPNTEGFDDIIAKFGILKEEAEQISKIVKSSKWNEMTGKYNVSYRATLKNGGTYLLGESSHPQVFRANETVYDSSVIEKAHSEALEINNALNTTSALLKSITVPSEFASSFDTVKAKIEQLNKDLTSGTISVKDYGNSIKTELNGFDNSVGEREKQVWNELTKSLQRYSTLQQRIANGKALSTDNEEAEKLLNHIYELQRRDVLPTDKLNASNEKLHQIEQTVGDLKARLKETTLDSIQGSIDKYTDKFTVYNKRPQKEQSATYKADLQQLEQATKKLINYKTTLSGVTELTEDQRQEVNKLIGDCEKAANALKNMSAAEKGAKEISLEKFLQRANKDLAENTRYSAKAKAGIKALIEQAQSGNPSVRVEKLTSELIKLENAEIAAGRAGKSFWDIFKTKSTYGFIGQMQSYLSMYIGFYGMVNKVRNAVTTITELDTALVDLKKTTAMNENQLENFYYDSNNVAKQMGVTTKEIIEQASAWSRLGYSTKEASTEMAKLSSQFASISPGMDVEQSQSGLVSIMKAKFYALIYSNVYLEYI